MHLDATFKPTWTVGTLLAAITLGLSSASSLAVTAAHWGSVNTTISQQASAQATSERRMDLLQEELQTATTRNAVIDQKLDDVITQLNQIEKDVKP